MSHRSLGDRSCSHIRPRSDSGPIPPPNRRLDIDGYRRRMREPAVTTRSSSTVTLVLKSRLYLRATASLFFAGLGISVAMPQISLFLVQDLHASLPVAGLFFLTNFAAPVFGFMVGRWSDRLPDRLSLFRVGALVGLVGWVVMALTTQVWMAFAVNLTLLGFAGATGSLIFAAVRDQLTNAPTGADNRVMSTVRLGFSLGFMTGPLAGSALGGVLAMCGDTIRFAFFRFTWSCGWHTRLVARCADLAQSVGILMALSQGRRSGNFPSSRMRVLSSVR